MLSLPQYMFVVIWMTTTQENMKRIFCDTLTWDSPKSLVEVSYSLGTFSAKRSSDKTLLSHVRIIKGTVHPKIRNTYFSSYLQLYLIHLDCFGVSCRVRDVIQICLPSLEYNGIRWHVACLQLKAKVKQCDSKLKLKSTLLSLMLRQQADLQGICNSCGLRRLAHTWRLSHRQKHSYQISLTHNISVEGPGTIQSQMKSIDRDRVRSCLACLVTPMERDKSEGHQLCKYCNWQEQWMEMLCKGMSCKLNLTNRLTCMASHQSMSTLNTTESREIWVIKKSMG